MGRLSAYAKNRILKLRFKKNKRIIHIVDILKRDDNIKVSRQAVSTFLKKYLETNSIYDKPRTGRKRKLTQEEIQLIGQVTRLNRDITARAIKEYLNLNVSTYTILRATKLFEWNKANSSESKKNASAGALNGDSGSENSPLLTTSLAAEGESGPEGAKAKKNKAKATRKYNKRKRADSSVSNANDSFLLSNNNNTDLDGSIANGDDENGEVEKIQLKPLVDQELKKNINNNLDKANLNTRYEKPAKTRHSVNSIPDFEKVDLNLIPHHELMILKNLSCSPMSFATKILFKIFKIDELHGHNVSGKTLNKNLKAKLPLDPLRVGYIKFLVEKYYDEKECKEMLCGATTHKQDLWKSCHTAINKSILISERKAEAAAAAGKVFVYGDTSLLNFGDDIKPSNNHGKMKKDAELNSSGELRKSAKKRNVKKMNTSKYSEGSDSDDMDEEDHSDDDDDSDHDESDDDQFNSSNEHRRNHHDGDDEYDDSDSSFNDTPLSKLKNSKLINKKDSSKVSNAKKQLKQKQSNAKKPTNKKFKANFDHSFSDDDDDDTETSDDDIDDDDNDNEELDEEIELIQHNRHRNVAKSSSSTTTTSPPNQQPESNLLLTARQQPDAGSSEASAAANIAAAMKKRLVVVAAVEKPTSTAEQETQPSPNPTQPLANVVNSTSNSASTKTTLNRAGTVKSTVRQTINRRISPPPKSTPPVTTPSPAPTSLRSKQVKETSTDTKAKPVNVTVSDNGEIKQEQTSPKVTAKVEASKQNGPKSLRNRQPTTPVQPIEEPKTTTIITRSRSLRRN